MKTAALIFLCLGLLACDPPDYPQENADPVTVRSTRWGGAYSSVVMEYDDGTIKLLDPVCGSTLPVWPGMRAQILFRWSPAHQCFYILGVKRHA